jgi:hypothetical protein
LEAAEEINSVMAVHGEESVPAWSGVVVWAGCRRMRRRERSTGGLGSMASSLDPSLLILSFFLFFSF